MNKCIFIGYVGSDPEVKTVGDSKVANFRIGVNETYTGKDGNKVTTTEWVSLVAWRGLAGVVETYVKKGQQIAVSGKLKTESWEKDGVKQFTTKIVIDDMTMLGGKKEGNAAEGQRTGNPAPQATTATHTQVTDNNDDLPF